MAKRKIIVDVDDVLLEFLKGLNDFYNDKHGTSFKYRDYGSYGLHEIWGCSPEEALKMVHEFYRHPSFMELEPVEFAKEILEKLAGKGDEFVAASYRAEWTQDQTRECIAQNFSI